MQGSTIVMWTGRGRIENLQKSVQAVLRPFFPRLKTRRIGPSVEVSGVEPTGASLMLQHTPGAKWMAAGNSADSLDELATNARKLARHYLERGSRFSVSPETWGDGPTPSDLAGLVTSSMLGEVPGARVNEDDPRVRFRVVWEDGHGALGVELKVGPGGTPTGRMRVDCLVSGGMHSSVVAWHALLSGFRLRLLHYQESEESLLAVARLYAELSARTDPGALTLLVQDGGTLEMLAEGRPDKAETLVAGFHLECGDVPEKVKHLATAPLALLSEEEFKVSQAGLSVESLPSKHRWGTKSVHQPRLLYFGGVRADVHGVLDGLR